MGAATPSPSRVSVLSFPLLPQTPTWEGGRPWLGLQTKEHKSDNEAESPQASPPWKGQPGPISDGVSRVPCGSLMNPLLKYPRSGDGVGRLVCPPLTAAPSCSRLPHQQLLELPSALAGLHFHSVASPLPSPLLSAFAMRPLVGRSSPWRALALTLGPRTPPVPTCCPHLPLVDPTPAWSWLPFQHFFDSLHLLR